MSKELIDEIESKIAWNDMNIDETSISLSDVKRLLNELKEQAERVEELELEVNDWRDEAIKWNKRFEESEESHSETLELLHSTISEIKRYKRALEEISSADWNSEGLDAERELDKVTDVARKALEG